MKNYILNESAIIDILKNDKIVVIDGGARGELFAPFNFVNREIIQVMRFEPDVDAEVVDSTSNDLVFRKALWNSRGQIDINIAIQGSTSSVYPFNVELQKHIDPYINVRKTKEVVTVDTISLNELVEENNSMKIDFIKLDIHGAEYEVLEGASEVLKSTLGLLIETWVIPIHKGQKTRAHVEALAFDSGFYAFEEYSRSNWARKRDKFIKRQLITLDTLFFKDPILDKNVTDKVAAVKLIGMADLFEHNGYALQITEHFYNEKVLDEPLYKLIINHLNKNNKVSLKEKLLLKCQKFCDRMSVCAFK